MKESKGMNAFAGLLGLVIAFGMLDWAASIIHLPWSLNFSGAKDALLGKSSVTTVPVNPLNTPKKPPASASVSAHTNWLGAWTSLVQKGLLFLVLTWILIGTIVWYRKTGIHTRKSFLDFLALRWPQITLGYLLNRPALIKDAWDRHALAGTEVSKPNSISSQFAKPQVLRRVEQILFAAMKGSDIKVEEEVGQTDARRRVIRTQVVANWEKDGWRFQLAWPRGFQLDIYTKWLEWGPNMASIALRHYGLPALKGRVDDFGFLHIPLEHPGVDLNPDKEADTSPQLKPMETEVHVAQQDSEGKDGPLCEGCPPLSLLRPGKGAVGRPSEGKMAAKALEGALEAFQLSGTVHVRGIGPSLIQLAIIPERGFSPKMIISRADDLRMAAKGALPGLTLEGTDTEIRALVNRTNREIVALRDLLEAGPPKDNDEKTIPLLFPMGVDLSGSPIWISLVKTAHLLIAGTTGSGKSVFSQSMLTSLTFRYTSKQLQFILIDAKGTEMAFYEHIPHLLTPVISEAKKAIAAVQWAVLEMDNRNERFKEAGCRDFDGYLRKGNMLSRIIIFVDELYDLLVGAGSLRKDLEDNLTRIAQKARSAGIHLVAATQKPTVKAIPSILKGNVPGRMAFQVSSRTESGVILDETGAEKLIGYGDGLFKMPGRQKERIQSPFIDDNTELSAISKWWYRNAKRGGAAQEKNLLENVASELDLSEENQAEIENSSQSENAESATSKTIEADDESLPPIFLRCIENLEDKFSPLSGDAVWRMNNVAQNVVQICPVGAILEEKQLALAFEVSEEVARKALEQMTVMGFVKILDGKNVLVQRWQLKRPEKKIVK